MIKLKYKTSVLNKFLFILIFFGLAEILASTLTMYSSYEMHENLISNETFQNLTHFQLMGEAITYKVVNYIHFFTFVLNLVWFPLCLIILANNASLLSKVGFKYSMSSVFYLFFVPIVNFFKPLGIVKEICEKSSTVNGYWFNYRSGLFVWAWYSNYFISCIIGSLIFKFGMSLTSYEKAETYLYLKATGSLISILDVALGIALILHIIRLQNQTSINFQEETQTSEVPENNFDMSRI